MKPILFSLVIATGLLSGCTDGMRPSPFAWTGYKEVPPKQKFAYQLPSSGSWLETKHSRRLNNKQTFPERLKIVRGERPHDFSERFRELYIQEAMDPVEFLSQLKSTDELRCLEVSVNILKKVSNGFVYLEKGKQCRNHPNSFISYGKVVSTKRGLSNLQYQAVPERLSHGHIESMHDVIVGSRLMVLEKPASHHSKSDSQGS